MKIKTLKQILTCLKKWTKVIKYALQLLIADKAATLFNDSTWFFYKLISFT